MKAEFDVKLTEKDLFGFNIYQIYRGSQGILSILIAIVIFIMAGITFSKGQPMYGLLYIVGGIFVIVYIPVNLKMRVKRTMSTNEVLSGTLHYEVSENVIRVTQGEETGELPWNRIYKLVANDKRILIYSNRINAYIIPREQIGDQYEPFVEIAKAKLEKYRLKVK